MTEINSYDISILNKIIIKLAYVVCLSCIVAKKWEDCSSRKFAYLTELEFVAWTSIFSCPLEYVTLESYPL